MLMKISALFTFSYLLFLGIVCVFPTHCEILVFFFLAMHYSGLKQTYSVRVTLRNALLTNAKHEMNYAKLTS